MASDSAYVVGGIAEHIATWKQRDWRNSDAKPVVHKDLWEKLLAAVDKNAWQGVETRFWRIGRDLNRYADVAAEANAAAKNGRIREQYTKLGA